MATKRYKCHTVRQLKRQCGNWHVQDGWLLAKFMSIQHQMIYFLSSLIPFRSFDKLTTCVEIRRCVVMHICIRDFTHACPFIITLEKQLSTVNLWCYEILFLSSFVKYYCCCKNYTFRPNRPENGTSVSG